MTNPNTNSEDEKLRVTFVVPTVDLSGGLRVIATYAKHLASRGHEVTVVAPRVAPTWTESLKDFVRGRPVRPKEPPNHLANMGVPYRLLRERRPVAAKDVPDADVIVATWWETAEWIRDFPASKGAKAYFIQHHEVHMHNQPEARVNATWKLPYHKITISKWLVELARKFGDDDVSLVMNSVDTNQFHAPAREKGERPTIGLLYSTLRFKGCDVSIPAIHEAATTIPNLRVVAFGSKPESDELPLPDFTDFTLGPAQDRIRDLYAQCDVWLCGSRAEGFHLPPLEAMACRCPVVSTRVGGPLDIVVDGLNGFLADVEDVDGLAEHLRTVLSLDPQEWKKMSNAALKTALDYTWDDATDLFYDGLVRAISKAREPR